MKKVDYIVVGLGIAGICFSEQLLKQNKSFMAIDNGSNGATAMSGGIFNPTVLKRFNASWNTSEFYPVALSFYKNLMHTLQTDFFFEIPILRIFKSVEEQNDWSVASDKRELQQFLSPNFVQNTNRSITESYGFGKVTGTARINTSRLLAAYKNYLQAKSSLLTQEFLYNELKVENDNIVYSDIIADKIVFCDGPNVMNNPFFPINGIIPNKGEYLIVKAPKLKVNVLIKGSFYIIPLGDSLYKVGATFGANDSGRDRSAKAEQEISAKLKTMINCPFEIIDQTVGIRPTTRDRKPLLGSIANNSRVVFFNGLGSRGFTMAPLLSEILYRNITDGMPIPSEMDINRIAN